MDLRADCDAIVLSVARVSVDSVLQPGDTAVINFDSFTNPQYAREHPSCPNASRSDAAKDGAFYWAGVAMDEMKLHHLPAGFRMTPGMPVTVDIKVGQRTMLAYLLASVVPTFSEGMRKP